MEMNYVNWLITGGCGFIGTNLIAHIIETDSGARIRILDNLSVGTKDDLSNICTFVEKDASLTGDQFYQFELVIGDVRDYEKCLRCCEEVDVVVHLAASAGIAPSVENPREDMEANVIGTFNLLEAARHNNAKKFIFASSGASIGEVKPPIHEEKAPKPVSPYGAGKLAGEGYCSAYYRTYGIKTISLRFGNVYGPRSKHKNSVVAKFFRQALNGEQLEIFGDGNQTRDFIYIDDLIQSIILSAKADVGGETFQIATHKETTVNEIATAIKGMVEKEIGRAIDVRYTEPRSGDVKRNYSDISKAKKILGYEPRYDLYTGLKKTFEFFKEK